MEPGETLNALFDGLPGRVAKSGTFHKLKKIA